MTQERAGVVDVAAEVSHREAGVASVGAFIGVDRVNRLLVVRRQNQMRGINRNENFVPLAVVQAGSDENSFPLVQQG